MPAIRILFLAALSVATASLHGADVLPSDPVHPVTPSSEPALFAKSDWVYAGPDGKLIYQTTPAGDRIMDFSHAGYMGGGVALPQVPVQRTVKPSSGGDDSAAIQTAVNAVSAMPLTSGFRGAVLLAPGTFTCSNTITIGADGVVLRGSGATGSTKSTLKLAGKPHPAISIRSLVNRGRRERTSEAETKIADPYLPAGARKFTVEDASRFAVGNTIEVRRPVTAAWVEFMGMNNLVRDGKPQTWLRAGTRIATERRIATITGRTITLDVPLSDSYDSKYLNPPGTVIAKVQPAKRVAQCGVESLHIESPPQPFNHTEPHFTAIRLNAEDSWIRDVAIDETMNSVGINGRRITVQKVTVNRKARHQGSSKPAEFAPDGDQILLDRCAVNGDNIWFAATGSGHAGPIVLLNCTFTGNGRAEGHQRWTTGMLMDSCHAPDGGIDFRNRGSMGSGHGWASGWCVAWNCVAKDYIIQQPPGAANWMIGCVGPNKPAPRPFAAAPDLPLGLMDSPGKPVAPQSLYLAQLAERLGAQAVKNIADEADQTTKDLRASIPVNLILDGGFENGDGGWNGKLPGVGRNWEVICGGPHPEVYSLDSTVKHSGQYSQRMGCENFNGRFTQNGVYCFHMQGGQEVKHPVPGLKLGNQAIAQATKTGTIKPGHTYTCSVCVKIDGLTAAWEWFRLGVYWLDANGKFISESRESNADKENTGTHDWKRIELSAVAPTNAAIAKVYLHHHFEHGIVWYDDVQLVESD